MVLTSEDFDGERRSFLFGARAQYWFSRLVENEPCHFLLHSLSSLFLTTQFSLTKGRHDEQIIENV